VSKGVGIEVAVRVVEGMHPRNDVDLRILQSPRPHHLDEPKRRQNLSSF